MRTGPQSELFELLGEVAHDRIHVGCHGSVVLSGTTFGIGFGHEIEPLKPLVRHLITEIYNTQQL